MVTMMKAMMMRPSCPTVRALAAVRAAAAEYGAANCAVNRRMRSNHSSSTWHGCSCCKDCDRPLSTTAATPPRPSAATSDRDQLLSSSPLNPGRERGDPTAPVEWDNAAHGGQRAPRVRVVPDGSAIEVDFGESTDGRADSSSVFHARWLWLYQPDFVHPSSGQRTASPSTAEGWTIQRASVVEDRQGEAPHAPPPPPPPGCLHPVGGVYPACLLSGGNQERCWWVHLEWKHDHRDDFRYTQHALHWLELCRYDKASVRRMDSETSLYPDRTAIRRDTSLQEVDHADLMVSDDACFDFLHAVVERGAALVRNAPAGNVQDDGDNDDGTSGAASDKTVAHVARRLAGGLSHGRLYGNTFHVQTRLKAQNIAYTSTPLPPHQDLVYYQSPPGLQLLHCVENSVRGGESTLIDALSAATQLYQWRPDLFDALTECSATFVKQRETADMVYRTPHIQAVQETAAGADPVVVAVRWAPPFQGPILLEPPQLHRYWAGYLALERMLDNSLPRDLYLTTHGVSAELEERLRDYAQEHTWERRLDPGDVLVFNNLRLLHGRRGFQLDPGGGHRHLIGCYTNMDDTLNRYRLLWRQRRPPSTASNPSGVLYQRVTGNGSTGVLL